MRKNYNDPQNQIRHVIITQRVLEENSTFKCKITDSKGRKNNETQVAEHNMATDDDVPSIVVHIQNTDQLVEVFIDELPEDVRDLLDLLRAEVAPLDIWHQFAVEYYRQGRKDAFREILKEAKLGFEFFEQKKLTGKDKEDFDESRLKIINALAADLIFSLIENEFRNDKDRFNAIRAEIVSYFSSADR